jgi:hypothetical protein
MAAGRSLDRMFCCVDEVPPDLHDFFKDRIYNRIKWRRRPDTAKALRLAVLLANVDQTMNPQDLYFSGRQSFMTFWLLTQNEAWDDHDYVSKQQLRFATGKHFSAMVRETSAFLEQACRDLLRVKEYGELMNPDGSKASNAFNGAPPHVETSVLGTSVQLLHRTVFDFLVTHEMETVLETDLPDAWKTRDILPALDVARLLTLPIGYEDPCGYFLSCQSAIRALWSAKAQDLPLLEASLDALVQEHFKLICRPHCTRHGHHMEFISTTTAQTRQAYISTLLDKHPHWCWILCLPDSLVKGGNKSSLDLPIWSRCIMSGFAAYDETSLLETLIQRFDMVDESDPADWHMVWTCMQKLLKEGFMSFPPNNAPGSRSLQQDLRQKIETTAPFHYHQEVNSFCYRYSRKRQSLFSLRKFRIQALETAKDQWLIPSRYPESVPTHNELDAWYTNAVLLVQ